MSESQAVPKKVSLEKLEKLSDEELMKKIKEKDEKIKAKKDYYDTLNKLNMERFENYRKHKDELAKICSTILSQRKNRAQAKPVLAVQIEKKANI